MILAQIMPAQVAPTANVSQGSGPHTTGVAALKDGLDPQCMVPILFPGVNV